MRFDNLPALTCGLPSSPQWIAVTLGIGLTRGSTLASSGMFHRDFVHPLWSADPQPE
jgi:hypothetical protein